jgi:wyosine [tRNA(Phe)-imidazoG37] synthetase (radical SAM superfamily)
MNSGNFSYVFGPVVSRRLGRSLGVDVVPFKTCTYDCTYCQLGATTERTIRRGNYVPRDAVLDEIRRKLASGAEVDYVTIAGSGEPTLYSGLRALIADIKAMTGIPVAVITNGALLWMPEVRDDLLPADLVVPSLDVGSAETFAEVNRPCGGIDFDRMIGGLAAFREAYRGQIWLEVFLLRGITDTPDEIERISEIVGRIRPDKIQLNTVARPAPGGGVKPVPRDVMERIAQGLGPIAEVVAHYDLTPHTAQVEIRPEDVLDVIRRHPCDLADIAQGLGISIEEARSHIAVLDGKGLLAVDVRDGTPFYLAQDAVQRSRGGA